MLTQLHSTSRGLSEQKNLSVYNHKRVSEKIHDQWVNKRLEGLEGVLKQSFGMDLSFFCQQVLNYLSLESSAYQALFFCWEENNVSFLAQAGYACRLDDLLIPEYNMGDGLIGQAARSQKVIRHEKLSPDALHIDFSTVKVVLDSVWAMPLIFNQSVFGVLEFLFIKPPDHHVKEFLDKGLPSIAATLESIYYLQKNQDYLKEAQEQREFALARKEELEQNIEEMKSVQDQLEKQKNQTEQALVKLQDTSERLMESLRYANRIQQIILPSAQKLNKAFSEHFIIYEPKDVVSGDFFWFGQLDVSILAVLDCTGHGVPGAFMTMIGYTLLNEIISIRRIQDPALILQELHKGIRSSLKQEISDNKDGMEAGVCRIELDSNYRIKLTFAGAKHSIYYFHENTMHRLKGDRFHLGGGFYQKNELHFENQVCHLDFGDQVYMFTDGITDLCNPQRRKFGFKRLTNLLENIHGEPMESQKQQIEQSIEKFKEGIEYRDDLTMLGIKF